MGWGARLLVGVVLVLAGAAAAVWALARHEPAARFLGIVPAVPQAAIAPPPGPPQPAPAAETGPQPAAERDAEAAADHSRIAALEARIAKVENATQRAEGSAGRADALVIAFAARRAIDRGVALGYLENLLLERFGAQHRQAVATVITASHRPVRLGELIADYESLGPELRRGGPTDSWWNNFKRELGSLAEIRPADRPAANPDARYMRAVRRLHSGDVDQALAETMRLPGAARAADWISRARRYVAAQRALDELESAALLSRRASAR
ncbi:MAG TPA: hypothetical protein VM308_07830 [Sphingomicrobium sp.]|nr:hypothetical protein [Sphingomicrobium sp.]